ncbi:LamG domain-containing protein [Caulobacter sp. LARHSG274]
MAGRTGEAKPAKRRGQTLWTFDRLVDIGGAPTQVEGAPKLVDSPWGQAVQFDGVGDRLLIDRHPLAGAAAFTFEAVFRPDGGAQAQRWFHLAEDPPLDPSAPATRLMFEIRVFGDQWCLDAFANGPGYKQTLIFPDKLFPVGRWHHVAQTCDGATYRSYVDGQLQGEAAIAFKPQGPGRASVGARMNRVDYFKGAIREARFTPRALAPDAFHRPRR